MKLNPKIDPQNLTFYDVFRLIAPTVAIIASLIVVGRIAPDFLWLLMLFLVAWVYWAVKGIPKENLVVIAERERELEQKVENVPYVGTVAMLVWRVAKWLSLLLSLLMLIVFLIISIKKLM